MRRIGERRSLGERIPAVILVPSKGRRRRRPTPVAIQIDNVSVSGLGFFAPSGTTFEVGEILDLQIDQLTCTVDLRRVEPEAVAGWTYFGGAFVGSALEVLPALEQQLVDDEVLVKQRRWSRSTGW